MSLLEQQQLEQQRLAESTLRQAAARRKFNQLIKVESVGIEEFQHPNNPELTAKALKVYYSGVYGYILKDMIDDYDFKSLQTFIGGQFDVFIEQVFKDDEENLIFLANRKDALEHQSEIFWNKAKVGQVHDAFISGVDRYTVWLIIEGVRVRMTRDEYSYKFQSDLQLVAMVGDTMQVRIVNLDKEERKVKVSRRVLEADPKTFLKDYKVGGTYGAVVEHLDYENGNGVFVTLSPKGITALAGFPDFKLGKHLQVGSRVNFRVRYVDENRGFIGGTIFDPSMGQVNRAQGANYGKR